MPYTITNLDGEYNPSYILTTSTLSTTQSAVDDTSYVGNQGRSYQFTTWNDITSSYVISYTSLSGYRITVVDKILLSGSSLIFAGCLASDFWNNFGNSQFNPPGDKTYLNVCAFDNTSPYRFRKLKNIGTYVMYNSSDPATYEADRVFNLALCGQNLVACGQFNLINTEITGAICDTFTSQASLSSLSSYGPPFTSNISIGQVVLLSAYQLLTKSGQGWLSSRFRATYSGDPATNIAYYTPIDNKWYAFPGSHTNLQGQLRALEVVNNTVYTSGITNGWGIFYHDGTTWQGLANSWVLSTTDPSTYGVVLGLTNDYKNRLIVTGAFSGISGDYKKSFAMRYNFTTGLYESLGNGFQTLGGLGGCFGSFLCGANIVVYGTLRATNALYPTTGAAVNILTYIDENNTMPNFLDAFNYNNIAIYPRGVYSAVLCGYNIVMGGQFLNVNTSYGFLDSYVAYVNNGTIYPFYIPPRGPFTPFNRNWTTTAELSSWEPSVRSVFDYVQMSYSSGTGVDLDTGTELLYNNQAFTCAPGLSVYGNSTYLGASGIVVAF